MIIRSDTENSHGNYLMLVMLTCETKMVNMGKDRYFNMVIVIVLMLYFIAKVLVHTVAGKAECSYFQLFLLLGSNDCSTDLVQLQCQICKGLNCNN